MIGIAVASYYDEYSATSSRLVPLGGLYLQCSRLKLSSVFLHLHILCRTDGRVIAGAVLEYAGQCYSIPSFDIAIAMGVDEVRGCCVDSFNAGFTGVVGDGSEHRILRRLSLASHAVP